MMKIVPFLTTFSTIAFSFACAAQSEGLRDAELIAGWRDPQGRHVTALALTLDDGWKTYWRAPGDAGFPPVLDFSNSTNIASVDVVWPTPALLGSDGFETLGYENRVVLPIIITPATNKDVTLSLSANIGVCHDICVPVDFSISSKVKPTSARDPKIISALANAPFSIEEKGYAPIRCKFSKSDKGIEISVTATFDKPKGWERLVVEYNSATAWVEHAKSNRHARHLSTLATLHSVSDQPVMIERKKLRLSIVTSQETIEQFGCS
jgi:DsbC/DsbD-like thiol-disulfide interchange protein